MGLFPRSDSPPQDAIESAPASDPERQATPPKEVEAPEVQLAVVNIDPEVEKRLVRKLDWNVVTLVAFLYLLGFLDRSNIGNAKIAGMEEDLALVGNDYAWLLTIFYISYTVLEFQSLMWKVVPPHMWAAFVVMGWGIVATCQAAAQNWEGMMALRFLLGLFEAGFTPGIPYLLSFFYRRHELGLRCGLFVSAAPLANTFAGALAYGITSGHPKLRSWRLLFLVEGIPTCVAAVLTYFYLPDHPASAKFLTEEEKQVARIRSLRRSGETERVGGFGGIVWKDVGLTLLDAKAWFTALMYFSCNVSYASLPVFLPTILENMGYSSINSQGLTAPPYFVSFFVVIVTTWIADKLQQRGLMVAFLSLTGAIGYVLLAASETVGVRYLGVFLAAGGVFPAIGNILPWVLNNQGSDTRRGMSIVLLNFIGQCGPFLGTNVFPKSTAPRYAKGLWICAGFMFFTTLLALGLRGLLMWENRQLDKKYANVVIPAQEPRDGDDLKGAAVPVAEENYGAAFRYQL